jgi:fructosamine-3-kinase
LQDDTGMDEILKEIERELHLSITKREQVYGGDINETFILHSSDTKFFLKFNSDDKEDMFEKEFSGLELLRSSNAITVPQPIITGKSQTHIYLVMECIDKRNYTPDFWQHFAQQLAALHKTNADTFGLDHDNYIGSIHQKNKQSAVWSEFYAEQRILYLIRKAFDDKKCDSTDIRMADRLCSKLDSLFPAEPPSLLHGDLWSGNFMINTKGQPVIYDPAVYYGHREMDIGMSLLFGGFDKKFYSHYNETWPMEKHWESRIELTQLYPLLVHLNLFVGHYYESVRDILKKYS